MARTRPTSWQHEIYKYLLEYTGSLSITPVTLGDIIDQFLHLVPLHQATRNYYAQHGHIHVNEDRMRRRLLLIRLHTMGVRYDRNLRTAGNPREAVIRMTHRKIRRRPVSHAPGP